MRKGGRAPGVMVVAIVGLKTPLDPLSYIEYGVYGDLSIIYPKSDSIYLRGIIQTCKVQVILSTCRGVSGFRAFGIL